jgi:hypothetical protein
VGPVTAAQTASVLRLLTDAKVQLVVVGDPGRATSLRLVVASHPTNLAAFGGALDRLGAVLESPQEAVDGPVRLGDPLGAMTVSTRFGPVDLLLGGPGYSLYADTVEVAEVRSVAGVDVRWVPFTPAPAAEQRRGRDRSPAAVSRRLLALVDAIGGPESPEGAAASEADDAVGPGLSPGATEGAPGRARPPSKSRLP